MKRICNFLSKNENECMIRDIRCRDKNCPETHGGKCIIIHNIEKKCSFKLVGDDCSLKRIGNSSDILSCDGERDCKLYSKLVC